MLTVLFVLMCIAAAWQRNHKDILPCVVFITPVMLFEFFGEYIASDWLYYSSLGITDFSTVAVLLIIFKKTELKIAKILSWMAFVSLVLNLVGFLLWYGYVDPKYYNYSFVIYYFIALCILLSGTRLWTGLLLSFSERRLRL